MIVSNPFESMTAEFQAVGGAAAHQFNAHNKPALLNELRGRAPSAKLELHHVLALRVYTTSLYAAINDPLRKRTKPHPLAATVLFIHEAIKVLRVLSQGQGQQTLWRGLKDVEVPPALMKSGGTELACMR